MFYLTMPALQAEVSYRQERLKRDYQRPLWLKRTPKRPVSTTPCLPVVQARPAM
ncbi:hypothetical protein OHA70_06720 [Kribbella sp. NBC_00382]|uniref:hypothetical protein n=1 Tax=Kribbella sp. NBC_00382 TaxID=2975967 RepID=UPI002E1C2AB5